MPPTIRSWANVKRCDHSAGAGWRTRLRAPTAPPGPEPLSSINVIYRAMSAIGELKSPPRSSFSPCNEVAGEKTSMIRRHLWNSVSIRRKWAEDSSAVGVGSTIIDTREGAQIAAVQ